MAIEYLSSSVSEDTAADAAVLAQNALRDALVAHPSGAWTLVEEFDTVGGEMHWTVLKNEADLSATGQDFYAIIGRHISDGVLGFMLSEGYTDANNTLDSFAPWPWSNSAAFKIGPEFKYYVGGASATFALGAALPAAQGAVPLTPQVASAGTMRVLSMVEKDYAILHVNGLTVYIGAMIDTIIPSAGIDAATPIGIVNITHTDGGYFGSLTRHPVDASVIGQDLQYSHALWPILNGGVTWISRAQIGWGMYGFPDRLQGSRVSATELALIMVAGVQGLGNTNARPNKAGVYRGKFKNVRLATFPPPAAMYDSVVVDGRKAVILSDRGYTQNTDPFANPNDSNNQIKWGMVFDTGVPA